MKPSFWKRCWEKNQLGFHQDDFHPLLTELFTEFVADIEGTVFVPLCGKSKDMVYISQTHDVLGCELSEIACEDFFTEKGLNPRRTQGQYYSRWRNANVNLWSGDIFKLQKYDLPNCKLVYDRAALIALPQEMRQKYVTHLRNLFKPGSRLLLISLEYPENELEGPPFSVPQAEVEQLFAGCDVVKVKSLELEDKKFAQRALDVSSLVEVAYFITF